MIQLNPMIPVYVTEESKSKSGKGVAFALIDYSQEHNVIWGIAFDDTGEIWWVDNKFVRFQINRSLGRL